MFHLKYGAAAREITPNYPVMLHGYGDRDRLSGVEPADAVCEPIYLGCLALDNGEKTVLFITADIIGIQSNDVVRLQRMVEEKTGIAFPDVVFSASHTHFAPAIHAAIHSTPELGVIEPDPRFVRDFETKVIETAVESLEHLQPGVPEVYRIRLPSIAFNRRTVAGDGKVVTNFLYPEDSDLYRINRIDDELTTLRIKTQTGTKAVLLNFGCHPVTGGYSREAAHYRISSDYPYYVRRTIQESLNCPVFFTLGAVYQAGGHRVCRSTIRGSFRVLLQNEIGVSSQCSAFGGQWISGIPALQARI